MAWAACCGSAGWVTAKSGEGGILMRQNRSTATQATNVNVPPQAKNAPLRTAGCPENREKTGNALSFIDMSDKRAIILIPLCRLCTTQSGIGSIYLGEWCEHDFIRLSNHNDPRALAVSLPACGGERESSDYGGTRSGTISQNKPTNFNVPVAESVTTILGRDTSLSITHSSCLSDEGSAGNCDSEWQYFRWPRADQVQNHLHLQCVGSRHSLQAIETLRLTDRCGGT